MGLTKVLDTKSAASRPSSMERPMSFTRKCTITESVSPYMTSQSASYPFLRWYRSSTSFLQVQGSLASDSQITCIYLLQKSANRADDRHLPQRYHDTFYCIHMCSLPFVLRLCETGVWLSTNQLGKAPFKHSCLTCQTYKKGYVLLLL